MTNHNFALEIGIYLSGIRKVTEELLTEAVISEYTANKIISETIHIEREFKTLCEKLDNNSDAKTDNTTSH